MAKHVLGFPSPNRHKHRESHFILVFVFVITTVNFVLSQTSVTDNCILNLHFSSSSSSSSNCEASNWGGFINSCCGAVFDEYLRGLGRLANQTGQICLNPTEQRNCLTSMKSIDENISACGFEKFTSGAGSCSDNTVTDVFGKLGNRLKNLGEDWTFGFRWNIRFAVLVTITGNRIDDEKWVHAVYDCLGGQGRLSLDKSGGTSSGDVKERTSSVDIKSSTVIVLIATCVLFRLRTKESFTAGKDGRSQSSVKIYNGHLKSSNDPLSKESTFLELPVKEIYSATNDLNASNLIGQGIAGKVYKGILSNGQHVAVKHIISDEQMNVSSFMSCALMGNLSDWLFGKAKALSWMQRIEIAIGSARGLWFLHTYPEGCIVHRDIKPTNILINANFQAKLSDFGLSKVMDVDQSHVSSEVRGTFGYVDPEYRQNRHVNASGDVYSFGIVLLQLLSGQRVINLNRPMPLNKMARSLTKGGDIREFVDPKLNGEYPVEAFDLILKLALSCTGIKQQRPSIE
ncbi:hypothetical protein FH972_009135 [Carpinus fangiana]|uniref:Protein kinase domain-containing protein n=1 Tax=Carpinus fangiana TaxID=176857 RepID=A0A5N6R0X5_9ROSI|nr:hypothetical protein FH972_009135 [Carpinus fangiana]